MAVVWPILSLVCKRVFASLTPPRRDLGVVLTVPERAATSPRKILWRSSTGWDTKRESISRSCWTLRNLRHSSLRGRTKGTCSERIVPEHVVRRRPLRNRAVRSLRPVSESPPRLRGNVTGEGEFLKRRNECYKRHANDLASLWNSRPRRDQRACRS